MPRTAKPSDEHYRKFALSLPPELDDRLQDYCERIMDGMPKARIVQRAITEFLDRHQDDKPIWER